MHGEPDAEPVEGGEARRDGALRERKFQVLEHGLGVHAAPHEVGSAWRLAPVPEQVPEIDAERVQGRHIQAVRQHVVVCQGVALHDFLHGFRRDVVGQRANVPDVQRDR